MSALDFDVDGVECGWRRYETFRIWADGCTTPEVVHAWGPLGGACDLGDLNSLRSTLIILPREWRQRTQQRYLQRRQHAGQQAANLWLYGIRTRARAAPLSLTADEEAIRTKAKELAQFCLRCSLRGCHLHAQHYGLSPPRARTAAGQLARYRDEQWWRRRLRKRQCEIIEELGRELGLVSARTTLYVTNSGLQLVRERKRRNRALLEAWQAVNEQGQAYTLAELADRSVANPELRRHELMARIAGTEQAARDRDHVGLFVTITCPSRFHATQWRSGEQNANFDGSSPAHGRRYLNRLWANIRRWLKDTQIDVYGLRVREPQHDGTPHDHYLLFVAPAHEEAVVRIMRTWALKESPNEPGAQRRRFDCKRIDYQRGSATGYIAKYISKNINGYGVEADLHGRDAVQSAERVQAWASIWGIRQFSFFGNPPVSVWRELRRLAADSKELPEPLKQAAMAADAGKWAGFIDAMGGIGAGKAAQPIRLLKVWNDELGRYGEAKGEQVIGVEAGALSVITRCHQWTINRVKGGQPCGTAISCSTSTAAPAATKSALAAVPDPTNQPHRWALGVDRRATLTVTATAFGEAITGIRAGTVLPWNEAKGQPSGKLGRPLFQWEVEAASRQRGDAAPWSSVNNCTNSPVSTIRPPVGNNLRTNLFRTELLDRQASTRFRFSRQRLECSNGSPPGSVQERGQS